jgi:hypothetical protein
MRLKVLEFKGDSYVALSARYDPQINTGYFGELSFQPYATYLSLDEKNWIPGYQYLAPSANTWYTLRLEVAGQNISYYINNQLFGQGTDSHRTQGDVNFSATPFMKVCVDDIRAWALTETGGIALPPTVTSSSIEIVTDKAATGDGGNAWGGHQTRIVRTKDGVFTAYTVAGSSYYHKQWQLAWRQEDRSWPVVAEGDAGKDPVNLLASPDGTLHIIGWPDGIGTMWTGKPEGNQVTMTRETIPGVSQSNWPYSSAGIDQNGDICVLSSTGGQTPGGTFMWACLFQSQGHWISHTSQIDYKFSYTYVFPEAGGQLSLISTRDVRWSALGYTQPPGTFDYVFNALGYWRTDNAANDPLQRDYFIEEKPNTKYPKVILDAQQDAYMDTMGNTHVIYAVQGPDTQGAWVSRHAIISPSGTLLNTVVLPRNLGGFSRIFQDTTGHFYILGSSGFLYPAGVDGLTLGTPIVIHLGGYSVEYSGYGISAPRTGTPISNVVDVVFPSGDSMKWIYFQLKLPSQ